MAGTYKKNFLRMTLFLFFYIVIFDMLLHNVLLMPYYLETQAHWRTLDEFKPLAPFFFIGTLVLAASVAALYLLARRSGSLREGVAIGAIIGALFAGRYMITFATENLFTIEILLSWIAAYALLEHAGCGAIVAEVYR